MSVTSDYATLVLFLCFTGTILQKQSALPSVVIISPPGLQINRTNYLSIALSDNAEIFVNVFDGSFLLQSKRIPVISGNPTNISIGPLSSTARSFLVRLDIRAANSGGLIYTKTLHIPRISTVTDIHLETDKAFYRPIETVRFRILSLSSDYEISTTPLSVLIKNPEELVVWQESFTGTNGSPFVTSSFHLPRHLAEGRWRILVKDKTTDDLVSQKHFDVLHYELPKFEVLAITNMSYYSTGVEDTELLVFARLATGRPVSGTLAISCTPRFAFEQPELMLVSTKIENGNASFTFNLRHCWSPSSETLPTIINVRADVRDYASGEKQSATVEIPYMATPYSISVLPLKPGLITGYINTNFTAPFMVSVFQPNGQPAEKVPILANVLCIQLRNRIENLSPNVTLGETNESGELLIRVGYRRECSALLINVSTFDTQLTEDKQIATSLLFPAFIYDAVAILQVDSLHSKVGESISIRILRSSTAFGTSLRIIAMTSSRVVDHVNLISDSVVLPVSSNMLPEFILILYHVNNNIQAVIDDIVRVTVAHGCKKDQIQIKVIGEDNESVYHPGSNATLILEGSRGTVVATKAIDKKFEQLARHLRLFDKPSSSYRKIDVLDRFLNHNETIDGLGDFKRMSNKTADICCSAGRVWWQVYTDCAGVPMTPFPYLKDCRAAFISCCSRTELPKADSACQRGQRQCQIYDMAAAGLIGSRRTNLHMVIPQESLLPSIIEDAAPNRDIIRRFFPEVWLFDEYVLSNDGPWTKSITLPHSITNWTITGRFWTPGAPVCYARTDIGIDASIYMEIDLPLVVYVGDQILVKVLIYNFYAQEKSVRLDVSKPNDLCTTNSMDNLNELVVSANSTVTVFVPLELLRTGRYEISFTLSEYADHHLSSQVDQVIKEIYAMARENIDLSLEHNFSWDLGAGGNINKWYNDTVLAYNVIRTKHADSAEIRASLFLNDVIRDSMHTDKVIVQIIPTPAAKRARWSKLKIQNDTRREISMASTLNEILLKAPALLQTVEDAKENDQSVPNMLLVQSNQLLHTCLMETLSFRKPDGAYSPFRIKNLEMAKSAPASVWLTVLATALHCRTAMDASVVCPSLKWLSTKQNSDGSFTSPDAEGFTTMINATDNAILLTSFTLLTMRVCSDYGIRCWPGENKNNSIIRDAVRYLVKVNEKKCDPLALGGITLAMAALKLPARYYNDALLKLLEEGSDYPYWTYKPNLGGFVDRFKHGVKGWFSTEYRQKMLSCQVLLNAMGLLAQLTLGNPKGLNLEQMGLWLIEHRKRDGTFVRILDTVFASRALIELQRSLVERDSNVVTKIFVQCENVANCPSITITPQNVEQIQTLELPMRENGLKFLVTGRGAVLVKFQFVSTVSLRDPSYYPVQMSANTSQIGTGNFSQELCFQTSDASITTCVIEHTFLTGLVYVPDSFEMTKGGATAFPPEPTSHSIHAPFINIKPNEEQCYKFQTVKRSQDQPIYSVRRPIVAKHPAMGVVGIAFAGGQSQGSQGPFLEKYCPPNSGKCVCMEATCPPPQTECEVSTCNDAHLKEVMKALCNNNYTGCLVKANSQREETLAKTIYRRVMTSKHASLSSNSSEAECKDLDILVRKSCACPELKLSYFYLVVFRRDLLLESNAAGVRPSVLIGERGFFEPIFSCSSKRQSDIQQLVQENQRREICANYL